MKKLLKRLASLAMAAVMMVSIGAAAMAVDVTSTAKITKSDGSDLKLNMGTSVIASCDLEGNTATVTFKELSLLIYTGNIVEVTGDAVKDWDPTTKTAEIDMSKTDGTTLAGVPIHITFDFNRVPPGMSESMDARFVCGS